MEQYMSAKRAWVKGHFAPYSVHHYDTKEGKLKLLDTIIKSNWIEPTEIYKLQSLGITLGDILVQDKSFEWVEIEDEQGADPALILPDTALKLFPLTMISKRLEKGEKFDIYDFYKDLTDKIDEIKSDSR